MLSHLSLSLSFSADTVTRVDHEIELSPTSTARDTRSRNEKHDDAYDRAGVVDAIPYHANNHRDEWDSPTTAEHSQVELVRNASYDPKTDRRRS